MVEACSSSRFPESAQSGPGLYEGLVATDEAALARFDSAVARFDPDESLLTGSPARSLASGMADVVQSLTRIDIERVAGKQSRWDRFTGADLEARLELEVAVVCLAGDMQALAEAAATAQRASAAMRSGLPKLDAAQSGHDALIAATHLFLVDADPSDPVVGRLQRRLGNLEALYASTRLARAQMLLAIDNLAGLLDRYRDIEQLLFPLWQQHALAVAQGIATPEGPPGLDSLRSIHNRFASALAPAKDAAS